MRTLSRLFQMSVGLLIAFALSGCITAKEMPKKDDMKAAEPAKVAAPIPAPDTDGDGVPDDADKCPGTPAGTDVDEFGCERDDDGDGVPNSRDECPNTAAGATVNRVGCTVLARLEGVNFAFDSAQLTDEGKAKLDDAANLIASSPTSKIEVAGHTDSIGPETYNQGLSERRANSAREYLMSKGIAGTRLVPIGYGEARPIESNDSRDGRAANRRVELLDVSR